MIVFQENPEIIEIDECSFEIRILNSTCTPRCTVRVINGLIDLRSLANVYNIPADHGLFSIGVCTSNPNCDENISSCLIKAKVTTPLSSAFETIRYNEDTAVIKFEAKFKGSRKSRKLIQNSWSYEIIQFCIFQWTAYCRLKSNAIGRERSRPYILCLPKEKFLISKCPPCTRAWKYIISER